MRRAVLVAGLLAACAAPAWADADPAAAVRTLVGAAMAATHSLRMQISSPAGGFAGTVTIVRDPLRMHMQTTSGSQTLESYVADGALYQRAGDGAWARSPMPQTILTTDPANLIDQATSFALAPDVVDAGSTYGALSLSLATGLSLTCTYDKQTGLLHACRNDLLAETFSNYNDPANDVALPADLPR